MCADGAGDDITPACAALNTNAGAALDALPKTLDLLLGLMTESLAEGIGETLFSVFWVLLIKVLRVDGGGP